MEEETMQKGNLVFKSGGWYFMRRVNSSTAPAIKLDEFIEFRYLPYAKELRPSTHRGYVSLWHAKIKGLAEAQLRVRDYRTMDVQLLLNAIAAKRELAKSTHTHIKAFLSGVFRYAVLAGVRESNPVRECKIPKGRPPAKTYAYSLDEIKRLLMVLDGGWKVAVAIAGYAGLRRAELQGLEWSDYDGKDLHINRNVWRGIKTEPKSVASKDYVPVIPSLKVILDDYKARATTIPVLPDLAHTHVAMRRLLKGTGLEWRGWHSFRRGLATNLGELGVAPKVIQRIMRH